VAVVYTNNSWGLPLAEGFRSKFETLGGKVLLSEGVAESTSDFRTALTKLKGLTDLDAIVSPTYPKEGGVLVRQAKELGVKATLFGGDNWGSPEFRAIAGQAAEGVFYTAPAENTGAVHADFVNRYEARFGEPPDVFAAYAFDAATAIFKAIEADKSTEASEIREALHQVSFAGASGEIAFRQNGDLTSEAFARKTIRDGQPVSVK
jgi:branched-chain amino acid transport system substrate-binding protein